MKYLFLAYGCLLAAVHTHCSSNANCSLSQQELHAISMVRNMSGTEILYRESMRTDEYLIKWLKATRMDPTEAVRRLTKARQWRLENKVDELVDKIGKQCAANFPSETSIVDKSGRPVWLVRIRDWDVRKAVLAGRQRLFVQCAVRNMELATTGSARNDQGNCGGGHFVFIADLKGFNVRIHVCPGCISSYVAGIQAYEDNYPNSIHSFYVINAPVLFHSAFGLAKSAFSAETRDSIKVFGFDQREWQAELLKDVAKEQLPVEYGGQRRRNM